MEPQRSILAIVSIWIYWISETRCCVIQSYPWHHPWPRSPQQWWCIERYGMWPRSTPGGRGEIQEILGNSDLVNISYRWLHMVWTFYHWLHLPGIKHPSKILFASLFLLITEKRAFLRVLILFPELIFAPYLTNVMFGPQIEVLIGKTQPNHVIQMKKSLCWVNVLLSLLGQVPTFYFLYSYLEEINPKANFLQFLMHGFSNPLRRDVNASFIPPYVAILSLGIAIVTLALLIHVDSFLESSHP